MDFEAAPRANARWAGHLECWRRLPYAGRLVRHQNELWFVKSGWFKPPGARERDRLGYLLGRGLANVAEVRNVTPAQVATLRDIGVDLRLDLPPDRVWLSRFACTSAARELPLRSLDAALAGELVYSLWIRRRDAHAFNRAFVDGLPIFFDHETAFLGEPELRELPRFFGVGDVPGYAGLWRLDVGDQVVLDTCALRRMERARFDAGGPQPVLIPVQRRDAFLHAVDRVRDAIRSLPRRTIGARVREAGFERREAREIRSFLLANQAGLAEHVDVLKRLLESPLSRQGEPSLS